MIYAVSVGDRVGHTIRDNVGDAEGITVSEAMNNTVSDTKSYAE